MPPYHVSRKRIESFTVKRPSYGFSSTLGRPFAPIAMDSKRAQGLSQRASKYVSATTKMCVKIKSQIVINGYYSLWT